MKSVLLLSLCLGTLSVTFPSFVVGDEPAEEEAAPLAEKADRETGNGGPPAPADAVALDPEILKGIRLLEHHLNLRDHEHGPYYQVLDHARKADFNLQKKAARELERRRRTEAPDLIRRIDKRPWWKRILGLKEPPAKDPLSDGEFLTFVDLFKNPEVYQGKLVTLRGHVHQFRTLEADPNEEGIETLFELWLFADYAQNNPTAVVCTSIPDDFPRKAEVVDHVSATGYFFRKLTYEDQGGAIRLAPLILAQRIEWAPVDESSRSGPAPLWLYGVIVALVAGLIGFGWLASRKERRLRQKRLKSAAEADPLDLTGLEGADHDSLIPTDWAPGREDSARERDDL